MKPSAILLLPFILFTMITFGQKPVDRLSVQGPINFDNKIYHLSWSAHPAANYYKQEYLQQGDDATRFKSMLMVEMATGAITPKNAMDGKVAELRAMRNSNPFISFDTVYLADKKEYLLDFVITQNAADNKSAVIAERNVYRYKALPGNNGVVLFAVSVRSYGAETKSFLVSVKKEGKILVERMRGYGVPEVRVK